MAKQVIKLDGVTIKTPPPKQGFKIEDFHLTKANRLANGVMKIQWIATKRKFYFNYDYINSTDLNTIVNILLSHTMVHTISYLDNNVAKTAKVYVGSFPRSLDRTGGKWYWTDFTFDLIEV